MQNQFKGWLQAALKQEESEFSVAYGDFESQNIEEGNQILQSFYDATMQKILLSSSQADRNAIIKEYNDFINSIWLDLKINNLTVPEITQEEINSQLKALLKEYSSELNILDKYTTRVNTLTKAVEKLTAERENLKDNKAYIQNLSQENSLLEEQLVILNKQEETLRNQAAQAANQAMSELEKINSEWAINFDINNLDSIQNIDALFTQKLSSLNINSLDNLVRTLFPS